MTSHTPPPTRPNSGTNNQIHGDKTGMEQLVFFSDAVFAIAITLLALEIRLPVEAHLLTNIS